MKPESILEARRVLKIFASNFPPGSELAMMCQHPGALEYVAVLIEHKEAVNFPPTGFRRIIEEYEARPKKPLPISLKEVERPPTPPPAPEPEKPRRRIGFLGTNKND